MTSERCVYQNGPFDDAVPVVNKERSLRISDTVAVARSGTISLDICKDLTIYRYGVSVTVDHKTLCRVTRSSENVASKLEKGNIIHDIGMPLLLSNNAQDRQPSSRVLEAA